MEIHQIRYFLAVCETLNFTHAAQISHISQPSLTQSIKKLEDELGDALFLRNRSGCQLTALGQLLKPKFQQAYQQTLLIKSDAFEFIELDKVPIRIGLMLTIGGKYLNKMFSDYQKKNPNTEMEFVIDNEENLLKKLHSDKIDFLISAPLQAVAKTYQSSILYEEKYVVAYSPEHHFSKYKEVSLRDIQTESYLDRLHCEMRKLLKDACQQYDINLYASYRSNSENWILSMVRSNMGIALLPEYTLWDNDPNINSQPLHDPNISRKVKAIYKSTCKIEVEFLIEQLIQT
jgi:DNA-binding transcriptional LysR family regulator